MRIRNFAGAALLGVAALGLSGCATGLPTKVTRYSAAIPQGQSFYVVPGPGVQGGLEFNRYASIVSQQMEARGFRPAGAPGVADMLVQVSYMVDQGTREYRADPFYDPWYGGYGGFGRPYFSRYGYYGRRYRSPFYWGWDDPFWYGGGFGPDPIRAYTVYKSELNLDILRRTDNQQLFDGRAVARSQTDELQTLVPNLIEAMFTNFPGYNGETVKITVPAKKRA